MKNFFYTEHEAEVDGDDDKTDQSDTNSEVSHAKPLRN